MLKDQEIQQEAAQTMMTEDFCAIEKAYTTLTMSFGGKQPRNCQQPLSHGNQHSNITIELDSTIIITCTNRSIDLVGPWAASISRPTDCAELRL
jgi:hypothetical protein